MTRSSSDGPVTAGLTQVNVVAGIIVDQSGHKILLSLRKPEQHQGNLWEFPGGKMEAHESPAQALRRELSEELGIHVNGSSERIRIDHDYGDKCVRLHFFDVHSYSGHALGREGQQIGWFSISELEQLQFPAANQSVVDQLVAERAQP